jgi:ribonuclease HI/probable phosphoglycerate mutase
LTRDQVLKTLAEQLDDALFTRLFPSHSAHDIRQIIMGKQGEGSPVAGFSCLSPVPAKTISTTAGGRCKLFTDGASRGNPGQAGAGAVIYDENGQELAAKAVYLGTCTNNVAEYKALLIGLEEALRLGCTELTIALDSELIVRQIQGRYKVKNETLLVLFNEVQKYLARLGKWSVVHVPRALNARADQLANKGIDQREHQEYP